MLIQIIAFQIIVLTGLLVVLKMLFNRHLNLALKRLKTLYEESLLKETELKAELERARQERASEVEKGRLEAKALLENAKKQAESVRLKLEDEAKLQAEKIIQQGREELRKLKKDTGKEIDQKALELAVQIIKYTLTEHGRETLHHELVGEILREIEHLKKEEFSVQTNKVNLTTPIALTPQEKEKIKQILSDKFSAEVDIEERLDANLIIGLIIEISNLVIDGSLKNKIEKMLLYLNKNAV